MRALKLIKTTRFVFMLGLYLLGTAATAQAQNQAPVNAVPTATQNAATGTPLVFSLVNANLISISDPDAGANPVAVTLQATNGTFTLNGTAGLIIGEGDGIADTKTSFFGTVANINTALAGLSFTPTASGNATLTITTNDLGNTGDPYTPRSDTDTVRITAVQSNQPPFNTVPAAQSAAAGTPLVFSLVNGNLISVSDPDAGANKVLVTLQVTNGTLTLSRTTGLTFITGDGSADATMSFNGTLANINAALAGLSFNPTEGGSATLTIATNDQGNTGPGGPLTDTDSVTINITPLNQAPFNTVPAAQNTPTDTPLIFSLANANLISISDPDAGANPVAVTLQVTNGTLTLNGTGVTFVVGDGSFDTLMTFTGTITAINAALANINFNPTTGFSGNAVLTITAFDQGNTGAGGAQSDTDTVTITVGDSGEPPTDGDNNVELTVSKSFTKTTATLVYKLKNRSDAELSNVVVQGDIGDFFGNNYTLNASVGKTSVKVLNPRSGERRVTWNNFTLSAGDDVKLTLTVKLPSGSSGKTIASSWKATFKTTGNGVLTKKPGTVKVP
jgi:hypothetical protein